MAFNVTQQSGVASSYISSLLRSIADRNMVAVELRKIDGDKERKQALHQKQMILMEAQTREADAKTKATKEVASITRISAEKNLMMDLMSSISDTYQNGLKKGIVNEKEYEGLQRGAGMTIAGVATKAKALDIRPEIVEAFAKGADQSIQVVGGRLQINNALMQKEPQKYEALIAEMGRNGMDRAQAEQKIKASTPQETQKMIDSLVAKMTVDQSIADNDLKIAKNAVDSAVKGDATMKMAADQLQSKAFAQKAQVDFQLNSLTGATDDAKRKKAEADRIIHLSPEDKAAYYAQQKMVQDTISGKKPQAPVKKAAPNELEQAIAAPAATKNQAPVKAGMFDVEQYLPDIQQPVNAAVDWAKNFGSNVGNKIKDATRVDRAEADAILGR